MLLPWEKPPTISVFHPHALLGCSKQPPNPSCLTPERNLLTPEPVNIPHKICSYLFCTCLLSQTILTRTRGGSAFPHTESLALHRNTFSLSCCHSQPPEEAQTYGQVLSTFWKSKGTLSNIGSVCIYTEVPAASMGFSLLFSLFSFQWWLCTWEHWAALYISLVLPPLAASVRPSSPERRDLAVRRSNKPSCSRVPPARRSPSPWRLLCRWKRDGFEVEVQMPIISHELHLIPVTGAGGKQVGQTAQRWTLEKKILPAQLDLKPMEVHGKNPAGLWWALDQGSVQNQLEKLHIQGGLAISAASPLAGRVKGESVEEIKKERRRRKRTPNQNTAGGQGEKQSKGNLYLHFKDTHMLYSDPPCREQQNSMGCQK